LTMGMQQGLLVAREVVVQPFAGIHRQPVALLLATFTVDAVVRDERAGVDRTAGTVEGVSDHFRQRAWQDMSTDHGRLFRTPVSVYLVYRIRMPFARAKAKEKPA